MAKTEIIKAVAKNRLFDRMRRRVLDRRKRQLEEALEKGDKKKIKDLEIDIERLKKMKPEDFEDLPEDPGEPDPAEKPMTVFERTARR